jgi:hypothetical protein
VLIVGLFGTAAAWLADRPDQTTWLFRIENAIGVSSISGMRSMSVQFPGMFLGEVSVSSFLAEECTDINDPEGHTC